MSAGSTDIVSIDVVLRARADASETEEDFASDLLSFEDKESSRRKEDTIEKLEDVVQGLDEQGLRNLKAVATNPQGLVQNQLLKILGKAGVYGAVATAIIAMVIESPDIVIAVVEALGQKGGPLNQDYTRFFDSDVQVGIERELQFRRAVGIDIIITNQDHDYILNDPGFVSNSLVDIEITRSIRINSNQSQYGYVNGL